MDRLFLPKMYGYRLEFSVPSVVNIGVDPSKSACASNEAPGKPMSDLFVTNTDIATITSERLDYKIQL